MRQALGVSERRACRTLGQHRSTQRKVPCGLPDEERLTDDIIELTREFGRYGYRMITGMLNNSGWHVNHKRVERIWRREGLKVPRKQPKKGRLWLNPSRWGGRPLTASLCQGSGVETCYEEEAPMEKVSIVGLDIAKNSFHAHGAAGDGSKVFSKALPRGRVLEFFGQIEPCTIALEACAGAHHWSREISKFGHDVRLIAPQYVKPYVKRQKNDANDAEAIAEAASRPTMRFVSTKTAEQQGQAMVFKTREFLTGQRTQTINALRGHLAEHGIVAPKGPQHLLRLERAVAENAEHLPPEVTGLCQMFFDLISGLSERIDELTRQLRQIARQNDVAKG